METELVPVGRTVNIAGYAAQVWEIRPNYALLGRAELRQLSAAGDFTAAQELEDRRERGVLARDNMLVSGDLATTARGIRKGRARVMIDCQTLRLI